MADSSVFWHFTQTMYQSTISQYQFLLQESQNIILPQCKSLKKTTTQKYLKFPVDTISKE